MKLSRRSVRMFGAILCPVDFSAPARQALRHAVALSRRSGGRVTALYANDPLLTAAAAAAFDGRSLATTSAEELKAFITQAVGAREGARVGSHIATGEPARVIRLAARRFRADLIVVGTRGLSGAGKMFFGSTTERVLREATVPVLAIPPAAGRTLGKGWPGRRVLAAIDLDDHAASDARAFASVARTFDLPLTLAHVVEPGQLPPWLIGFVRRESQARADAARVALERLAAGLAPDVRADTRVLVGDPSEHIPMLARKAGAGLIVLALRRGDGAFGAAQGTITYRVLSSGCAIPILAMPSRGRRTGGRAANASPGGLIQLDPSAFT